MKQIYSLALLLAFCSSLFSQGSCDWTVLASKDDFTDEACYMVLPSLVDQEQSKASSESEENKPITNNERRAYLLEFNGGDRRAAEIALRADPSSVDEMIKADRRQKVLEKSHRSSMSRTATDHSLFLRPVVAMDNGTLVVGVTVYGEMDFVISRQTYKGHSLFPVGTVQWRIDDTAVLDLDPAKNPPIHLPGSSENKDVSIPSGMPPAMAQQAEAMLKQQVAYAVVAGDMAHVLLDQLMSGTCLKIRRKSDALGQSLGETYYRVKTYALGKAFRDEVARIGLIRNSVSQKWELDPSKEALRQQLFGTNSAQKK